MIGACAFALRRKADYSKPTVRLFWFARPMTDLYDVAAIGNAIVDVIAPADDGFLANEGMVKGSMSLIDDQQALALYGRMAPGIETSGGSAANTVAGIASLGGRAAYVGKVANDQLGAVFSHDIKAIGVHFDIAPLVNGLPTARCLINVTPDGQRTMSTFLGASNQLTVADVSEDLIAAAKIVYLEGYLFDPLEARRAFAKATAIARTHGRQIALTLSDAFVVERHRSALLGFIDTEVDILFANAAEICALFETQNVDQAIAALQGRVQIAAVTRSEHGSTVLAGKQVHAIKARPVDKVLDTTGAGDQYAAGFLFGLAQGRSMTHCGDLGALAAAEVISHYGPRPLVSLRDLATSAGI
jgi:sugar/nucleoside kinase (ribokinase family)